MFTLSTLTDCETFLFFRAHIISCVELHLVFLDKLLGLSLNLNISCINYIFDCKWSLFCVRVVGRELVFFLVLLDQMSAHSLSLSNGSTEHHG